MGGAHSESARSFFGGPMSSVIVAFSGAIGAGKSSISKAVAQGLGCSRVSFGDYVRSVRIKQYGTQTQFSLIGKAGQVRYEIGGTSRVFQDITRANIKIEYPPITSLKNLVLRLQRRDPIQSSSTYSEMINEFGVKYRFEF